MNKPAGLSPRNYNLAADDSMTETTGRIFNIQRYSLYDGRS